MADIRVDELTQETLSTLTDSKKFVMFDTEEGKSATLGIIKEYISGALETAIYEIESTIETDEAKIEENTLIITEEYNSSETYDVGDYVIRDNSLYKCKTAITTPESWTSSHWELSQIGTSYGTVFY